MKKIQLFFALVFICVIIIMVAKEFKREKKLYRESVTGKVISVEKALKGYYDVIFIQNNKFRQISFSPAEGELMVSIGDSIYKAGNSDSFYIRKNEKPGLIKVEWKDIHIGGKWEE